MMSQELFSSDNTITPSIRSTDANGKTLVMKDSGDKNRCVQLASTAALTTPSSTATNNRIFALNRQQHFLFLATTLYLSPLTNCTFRVANLQPISCTTFSNPTIEYNVILI
jgi:hypothetical protein